MRQPGRVRVVAVSGGGDLRSVVAPAPFPTRVADHVATVERRLAAELDELCFAWDGAALDVGVPYPVHPPAQLRDLLGRGGKRTRPIMTFLGWVAGDVHGTEDGHDDMVLAAAALEMLHCFALVHDDVMDESPTRRGRPTVHEDAARLHARRRGAGGSARFGDSIAVLVGDLAHSEADRLAASLPTPMRAVWQHMVVELIAGQLWDVVGSAAGERRVDFARLVARQKTGHYSVTRPLQLGAVAAGAQDESLAALAAYGGNAGEAFALRDDLLGVYGDPAVTGKPVGDDIRSGKPTVLLALAAERLRGTAARTLDRAGSPDMTDADVLVVQDAMVDQGVVAEVEAMVDDRVSGALSALATDSLSGAGVEHLGLVVGDLARRAS